MLLSRSTWLHTVRHSTPLLTLTRTCAHTARCHARATSAPVTAVTPYPSFSAHPPLLATHTLSSLFGPIHINWFPGHMKKAMSELNTRLRSCSVILEVRDARLPLSSYHPLFESAISPFQSKRIIVFNKSDLCSKDTEWITAYYKQRNLRCIFISATQPGDIKRLLQYILSHTTHKYKSIPVPVMIVGYPNTGKSSLINSLRANSKQSSAAKVGALPGITRHISGFIVNLKQAVSQSNSATSLYLFDSPGIMTPSFPSTDTGLSCALKIAATGSIKDYLADETIVARYLLLYCNQVQNYTYVQLCQLQEPTNDWTVLVQAIQRLLGKSSDSNGCNNSASQTATAHAQPVNLHADAIALDSAKWFLKKFRSGELGRLTLDSEQDVQPIEAMIEQIKQEEKAKKAIRG